MNRRDLLKVALSTALVALVATTYLLAREPGLGVYERRTVREDGIPRVALGPWLIPRDLLYQWNTTLAGVLVASLVVFFLPLRWRRGKTPNERIASNICVTAIVIMVIYAMAGP